MKKQPLWFWGFLCILGGSMTGLINQAMPALKPKNQAEALGQGVAVALFWMIGLVLIGLHFAGWGKGKGKKSKKKRKRDSTAEPK